MAATASWPRIPTAAGNTGTSTPVVFTLSTTGPTVTESLAFDTGSSASDNITSNDALTGTGLASTAVDFTIDGSLIATTVTTDALGAWSFTPTGLGDGAHTIVASQTDAFSNIGTAALSFTLDTIAPAVVITTIEGGDNIINAAEAAGGIQISGTAEIGSTLTVNGSAVAVDGTGHWTTSVTPAGQGALVVTAVATDAAGNSTTTSTTLTVDTTAPAVSITGFTPDSGTIGDGITNATTVTVSGTAEIGSLVTLFDNLNSVGTVAADGSGHWSISESGLTNGSIHSFTATATDNAGNISSPTAPLSVTIITGGPAEALSITAIATDSGTVGDFITSDTTLTVSGTNGALAAGEKIQISSNGGTTWTDVVQGTATAWSLVDPTTHATSFTYQARIIDAAANVGTTASQAVTIDTTAPAVSITGFTPDSGTIGDGITNATTVTVSGTAEIGSLVTLFDNLNSVGTVAADGSGQWSISESGLTNGSIHSFTATATDNAGNISSPTAPLSVTIITGGPAEALSITAIATDSGTVGDFITSDTTLTVSGTNGALAAGEKIQISSDGGTTWTDVVQNTTTAWSLVDPTTHATSFTYQARIIDAAANVGTTASQAVTIDTTAPAEALSITAIATDSGTVGDFITSDTTLTVSGTNGALAAGEKIQISSNGGTTWTDVVQGTATAWSLVDPTTHATSFTYQARIIDAAANVGTTASQAVTIDTTAPAVSITGFTPDSGTIGDGITNATTVTVSGTAEIGSLVTLFDNLNSVGTVAADGSGQWSISESGLTNGSIHSFTATATDNAGNISSPTAPLSVTIITGGPAEALSITAIATDSGTVGDFITSDTTLTVSGTNGALAAGEKIQISSDGGTTWTDVVQNTTTAWSLVDPTTHATSFTYQARIIDAAANVGTTASQAVTIDTTAPAEALRSRRLRPTAARWATSSPATPR